MDKVEMQIIARMKSDFSDKFGIPRQSGLVETLRSTIVFEPTFRNADSLRGLDGFSHLWVIWQFSEAVRSIWSPTVRPPRLGGNTRLGVFATRSPFRPNPIGLSSVKIISIEHSEEYGTVINVSGADLMDGTPILDIKPYIPYCDIHNDATEGFTATAEDYLLKVNIASNTIQILPDDKRQALLDILSHDPRPSYQKDSNRVYGLSFAGHNIRFRINDDELTVLEIIKQ